MMDTRTFKKRLRELTPIKLENYQTPVENSAKGHKKITPVKYNPRARELDSMDNMRLFGHL